MSDNDYQIKRLMGKKTQVVHFSRLKHCDPDTRFDDPTPPSPSAVDTSPSEPETFGQDMELLDSDSDEPPPGPPSATAPGTRIYPSCIWSHSRLELLRPNLWTNFFFLKGDNVGLV